MKQTSLALLLATCQVQCLNLCMSEAQFQERLPNLKQQLKEWTRKSIVSFSINEKKGTLNVVSTDDGVNYQLVRFFAMVDIKWEASCDYSGDAQDMIDYLLKKR